MASRLATSRMVPPPQQIFFPHSQFQVIVTHCVCIFTSFLSAPLILAPPPFLGPLSRPLAGCQGCVREGGGRGGRYRIPTAHSPIGLSPPPCSWRSNCVYSTYVWMEGDRVGCPYLTHWVSDRPPAVGQTAVLRKVDIVLVLHTVVLVLQIGICSSRNNKNGTLKHNAI